MEKLKQNITEKQEEFNTVVLYSPPEDSISPVLSIDTVNNGAGLTIEEYAHRGEDQAFIVDNEFSMDAGELDISEIGLVVSGILKTIHNKIMEKNKDRRAKKLEKVKTKIEMLETSQIVHMTAAQIALNKGRPKSNDKQIAKVEKRQEKATELAFHTNYRPTTKSELRRARRASYQLRRNMEHGVNRRIHDLTYSTTQLVNVDGIIKGGIKIGTKEHQKMLEEQRLTKAEFKEALRATHEYHEGGSIITRNIENIQRSANGKDFKGQLLSSKKNRLIKKANKLRSKIS